jgi:hypothetical protein
VRPEARDNISNGMRAKGRNVLPRREVVLDTGEVRLYSSIHQYMRIHFSKGRRCWSCGEERRLDWAHREGRPWSRRIEDWLPLCRSCNLKMVKAPEAEIPVVFGSAMYAE